MASTNMRRWLVARSRPTTSAIEHHYRWPYSGRAAVREGQPDGGKTRQGHRAAVQALGYIARAHDQYLKRTLWARMIDLVSTIGFGTGSHAKGVRGEVSNTSLACSSALSACCLA